MGKELAGIKGVGGDDRVLDWFGDETTTGVSFGLGIMSGAGLRIDGFGLGNGNGVGDG